MLAGRSSVWSGGIFFAHVVLIVLLSCLILAALIVPPVLIGISDFPAGGLIGMFGVLAMLTILLLFVVRGLRKQRRYRRTETDPIVVEQAGLTMRGIGPIPWADFGPAEHRMVPAERDSGFVRRAVMELTESGFANVNHRLPRELRIRLSPEIGPLWNRHHRFIYVPAAENLRQGEVMQLISAGRRVFWGQRA